MERLRVLIADDDPIIRLDLKQMLQNHGYDVIAEVGDGREAVRLASELKPDLCIVDIKMPIRDGISVVQEIVDRGICATILLTAYSDEELVSRATEAGAFAYLVKPFKPSDLTPAIEVAVARFNDWKKLNSKVQELDERLETRKLLERAKGILMSKKGLSEEEAYRCIQQSSMNTRKSMKEVAEAILLAESVSG